jgi:hypothetical protein
LKIEKLTKLAKFIDPLKHKIESIEGSEEIVGDHHDKKETSKIKHLLGILSQPSVASRIALDTLNKYENVLNKMDLLPPEKQQSNDNQLIPDIEEELKSDEVKSTPEKTSTRDVGFSPDQSFEEILMKDRAEFKVMFEEIAKLRKKREEEASKMEQEKKLVEKETQVSRDASPLKRRPTDIENLSMTFDAQNRPTNIVFDDSWVNARDSLFTPDYTWSSAASSDEFVVLPLPTDIDHISMTFDPDKFEELSENLVQENCLSEESTNPQKESTPESSTTDEATVEESKTIAETATQPTASDEGEGKKSPIIVDLVSSDEDSYASDFSDFDLDGKTDALREEFTNLNLEDQSSSDDDLVRVEAEDDEDEEGDEVASDQLSESVQSVKYQPLPQDGSTAGETPISSIATSSTSISGEQAAPVGTAVKVPIVTTTNSLVASSEPLHPTNPFLRNSQRGENVIHVLPESIVNGAVDVATKAIQNVSRVRTLFSPQVSYI